MRYGIIGALDEEIALVKEQMTEVKEHKLYGRSFYTGRIGQKDIVLVCCGVGKVNAALFANAVIREFHAEAVINIGIAGAIGAGIGVMDVVLSTEAAFHDQDEVMVKYYPFGRSFQADPALLALAQMACEGVTIHGKVVSGLIVIVATFIFIFMSGKPYQEDGAFLGNEQVKMDLNGVHVIKVFTSQDGVSEARRVFISGEMKIGSTAASSGKEQVSYPKGDYLNVTQKNDTLFMKLDFNVNNIPEKYRDRDYIFVSGFDVSLAVDSLTGIVTGEEGLKLNLIGIETDSLFVRGNRYNISLDSCRLGSCDIQGNGLDFHAKDSKIENFYLNLDGVWRWTFENTEVGTEYLSGSNQHSNDLQKGECKRVVWTPLTEDARLQVNVREKAEITITPE